MSLSLLCLRANKDRLALGLAAMTLIDFEREPPSGLPLLYSSCIFSSDERQAL
jgi:hypothetical protein